MFKSLRSTSRPTISRIRAIKRAFIDYSENPGKYMDLNNPQPAYDCYGDRIEGAFTVNAKTFEEVLGITCLGQGHYGRVYTLDEGFVLKIEKELDTGYRRFVEMVQANPNPHFPKILYSGNWAGKQVYVLEKLQPTSDWDVEDDYYCEKNPRTRLNSQFRDAMHSLSYKSDNSNPYMMTGFATRELEQAARLLAQHSMLDDLHGNNMMWRGDCPVVTDPCTY